jgi:hypothetical protein
MNINENDPTTLRAARFDECYSELSEEAQRYLSAQVNFIAKNMANGGGEKSAKALLYNLMIFADAMNIQSSDLVKG